MVADPVTVPSSATSGDVARVLRDADVSDVIIVDDDRPTGIVSDRDIVVRGVADGGDTALITVAEIASGDLVVLTPSDTLGDAGR